MAEGVALTARAQVKGYQVVPLLLYTNRRPRVWAIHKRNTLLGQAQNGAWAGVAVFTVVKLFAHYASHDPRAVLHGMEGCT